MPYGARITIPVVSCSYIVRVVFFDLVMLCPKCCCDILLLIECLIKLQNIINFLSKLNKVVNQHVVKFMETIRITLNSFLELSEFIYLANFSKTESPLLRIASVYSLRRLNSLPNSYLCWRVLRWSPLPLRFVLISGELS